MSDKIYTLPSGAQFEVKPAPGKAVEVAKPGEKSGLTVRVDLENHALDPSTTRFFVQSGKHKRFPVWVSVQKGKRYLSWPGGTLEIDAQDLSDAAGAQSGGLKPLKITMPGKVLAVKVKAGDVVEQGQGLVVVEAMKMENILMATGRARVQKVHVQAGDRLESGALLVSFEEG